MASPTDFEESDAVLGPPKGHEADVLSLPIKRTGNGEIISCWQLSPEEIAEIARTGRVWLSVWGPQTQPPVLVTGLRDDVLT